MGKEQMEVLLGALITASVALMGGLAYVLKRNGPARNSLELLMQQSANEHQNILKAIEQHIAQAANTSDRMVTMQQSIDKSLALLAERAKPQERG